MFSRLVLQRVPSRAFAPGVGATAAVHSVLVARQHLARSFLTTAHLSEPVAKDSESTKAKSKAKATTTKKATTAKKVATKKAATKKAAGITTATAKTPRKKAAPADPAERLKAPLKDIKLTKADKPPTKGPTAYSLYMREQYVIGAKVNNRDEFMARSKAVGAQWNQLSDEAKKPYFEKEKELREDYHKKLAEWFETTDRRIVAAYNKQRKAANKQRIHAPLDIRSTKPMPSFIQFSRDIADQVEFRTDLDHKEALSAHARAIADKWKALPEQERERYKIQYKEAMDTYKQEHPTA